MSRRPRRLDSITPNENGAPKGFVPYRPAGKKRPLVERTGGVFEEMEAADALPIGPRQVGYRLKERHAYTKDDFDEIGRVIKRLTQAREIAFEWVADGASRTLDPGGFLSMADFLAAMPDMHSLDRRIGQPIVLEVYTEARETLPLIARVCQERGVLVYSGSGSSGPGLARKVAIRALHRAVEYGQSTRILAVCDFDESGIKSILRPHIEHVAAFLHGIHPRNEVVLAYGGKSIQEIDANVEVVHLALTPEMACELEPSFAPEIEAYMATGVDLFDRDISLLSQVPKIELEALDPATLRSVIVDALDDALDQDQLYAIATQEALDRESLRSFADSLQRELQR